MGAALYSLCGYICKMDHVRRITGSLIKIIIYIKLYLKSYDYLLEGIRK